MNDNELLEAAAKAAGIVKFYHATSDGRSYLWRNDQQRGSEVWAPLDDDGDALRLAVALSIEVQPYRLSGITCAGHVLRPTQRIEVLHAGDSMQSTRRAIVRAAAAMCPCETPNV